MHDLLNGVAASHGLLANDTGRPKSTAAVTVTVVRPNAAPIARDDLATVAAGASVAVPVLANDSDPDGDPLRLLGVTAPVHGSVAVNPGDTITYSAAPGLVGPDEFVDAVGDGRGGSAQATVTVHVEAAAGHAEGRRRGAVRHDAQLRRPTALPPTIRHPSAPRL